MKKVLLIFLLAIIITTAFGQVHNEIIKNDVSTSTNMKVLANKGNKVYLNAADTYSEEGIPFLKEGLQEFDYWAIVDTPDQADFIINLKCRKEQLMTVVAVHSTSSFVNANGDIVLQTKEMKGTPTAFNSYNSFKGSVLKMIDKVYKKEFK